MSNKYNCMLAHTYDERKHNPVGLWMSEKLDGRRVKWLGDKLVSRNDHCDEVATKVIHVPDFWKASLPKDKILDGELFMGRGKFQKLNGILNKNNISMDEWARISFQVFDVVDFTKPWIERFRVEPQHPVMPVMHYECHSIAQMEAFYNSVVDNGGEGIMLRNPLSAYNYGRVHTILKVKPELYAQGVVTGYTAGEGKYAGMVGALLVDVNRTSTNKHLWTDCVPVIHAIVGSGLTDADRTEKYRPKVGSRVQLMFTSFTDDGNLRFPRFNCRLDS